MGYPWAKLFSESIAKWLFRSFYWVFSLDWIILLGDIKIPTDLWQWLIIFLYLDDELKVLWASGFLKLSNCIDQEFQNMYITLYYIIQAIFARSIAIPHLSFDNLFIANYDGYWLSFQILIVNCNQDQRHYGDFGDERCGPLVLVVFRVLNWCCQIGTVFKYFCW